MTFPNDSSRIARGITNLETSTNDYTTTPEKAARSLIRKTYHITEVPSVLANGDNAIVANAAPSIFFKQQVRVLGVNIKTRAALTEHASNLQNLSLKVVSNVGVIGTTIAVKKTNTVASGGTGNLAQGQSFTLTVDAANAVVAANTWVAPAIAPSASGVAIAATSWAIDVEEEGPDGYQV